VNYKVYNIFEINITIYLFIILLFILLIICIYIYIYFLIILLIKIIFVKINDIKWNIQTLINIKLVLLFKHKLMS